MDDVTIAQRIRSEVLGGPSLSAKGIVVDVNEGVARFRGQLDDAELIHRLVEETKNIPGVRDVESLLHPAGASAPNKVAARSTARAGGPPSAEGSFDRG
jgi:hypothetical protein